MPRPVRMHALDSMTRTVVVANPRLPLDAAWRAMTDRRIRHLPVVDGGRLVGILSDRDVLLRASLDDDGRIIVPGIEVGVVMSTPPVVCERHTTLSDIARTMIERKIDALPVVDDARLIGLLTSTDLLALLVDQSEEEPLPFAYELEDVA